MRSVWKTSTFVASLFLFVLPAVTASAQSTPGFGHAGQLAVSWDQPLVETGNPPSSLSPVEVEYTTFNNNGGSGTSFSIAPAADYFIVDNVSLGAQLLFGLVTSSPGGQGNSTTTTLYGLAPQVGYNLGITDTISFWPKLFLAFSGSSASNNNPSNTYGTIGIYAPFLFHLAPHFFLGGGPNVSTEMFHNVWQGNQSQTNVPLATQLGLMATFGGYFLGD